MQKYFEQRLITISPTFKGIEKLTSDVIFQYLNEYTQKYVKMNYLKLDQLTTNRTIVKTIANISSLLTNTVIAKTTRTADSLDKYLDYFTLPSDYFLYVRSVSGITSSFIDTNLSAGSITPNVIGKDEDINKVISAYYNNIILPNPYIIINGNEARVLHDKYTTIDNLSLVYYRLPKEFNVIGVNGTTILDQCELPENTHQEIVEGAVDMFITEYKFKLQAKADDSNKQKQ